MEDRSGLCGLEKKERKRNEGGGHMNLLIWSPGAEFDTRDSLPFLIRHHFMI